MLGFKADKKGEGECLTEKLGRQF